MHTKSAVAKDVGVSEACKSIITYSVISTVEILVNALT